MDAPHPRAFLHPYPATPQEMRPSVTMSLATLGELNKNQFTERKFSDGQVSN